MNQTAPAGRAASAGSSPPGVLRLAPAAIEALWKEPPPVTISTGIAPLDAALNGGLMADSLSVLIAATGRGKTGFVIQLARGWLAAGRAVLFIETELTNRQTLARFVAQELGEPWHGVMQAGTAEADRFTALAVQRFPRLAVHEWQRSESASDVFVRFPSQMGKPLVIVDQIGDLARARGSQDMRVATAAISGELKQLAKQQGTVVLAVSGTSRAVAAEPDRFRPARRGRQYEAAAKDAGEIEYDGAALLYLESDPVGPTGVGAARQHLAKARNGLADVVIPLRFCGAIGTFEAAAVTAADADTARALEHIVQCGPIGLNKLGRALKIGQVKAESIVQRLSDDGLIHKTAKGL